MTARFTVSPVLVIDDSLTIRKLLEMALDRAGHSFEVAGHGREGLALAKRVKPKLILLDYVLPDLKGSEVCDELAADPATAGIPVVVMSGKGEDIRPLFRNRATVVDFIAKPFSPAEILHVVNRALGRVKGTDQITRGHARNSNGPATASYLAGQIPVSSPTAALEPKTPESRPINRESSPPQTISTTAIILSPTTREGKESAAKIMFAILRERLARIPEWLGELGSQPAAPYFAKKLLTPDVVGGILQGLAPLMVAEPAHLPVPATDIFVGPPGEPASDFTGSTGFLPLPQLLRLIAETHRTGELHLSGQPGVSVFVERGRLLVAVPRDPQTASRILTALGTTAKPEDLDHWEEQESQGGLPAGILAAAQAGEPAREVLNRLGRQALVHLGTQGPSTYAWRDLDPLPEEISKAALPLELEQLALDRLRQVDDWSQIELEVRSLDQRCLRAPGFANILAKLQLSAEEERVLLHVNGRNRVKDILDRSRLSTFDVFHILYRMIQLRLVATLDGDNPAVPAIGILLCAPGESPLAPVLETWLAHRGDGLALARNGMDGAVAGILAQRPRLVLVETDGPGDPRVIPREIRATLAVADRLLVAVTARADLAAARGLTAAGYDHVLIAPFHLNELARLLDDRISTTGGPVAGQREFP